MPGPPAPVSDEARGRLEGCLYAAHGVYAVAAGLALAVFCWLIPMLLAKVAASDVLDPDEMPALARTVLDRRAWMPLLALPTVLLGVLTFFKVPLRWLLAILALVAMLVPAALMLYTFVVTIGLLYQYRPL